MKRALCLLFLSATLVAGGESDNASASGEEKIVINFLVHYNTFNIMVANEFNESQDRIRIDIVEGPTSATEVYTLILQMFESQKDSIDILPVDPNWAGDFADHLLDLNTLGAGKMADQMFDNLVDLNTLNGRLLALPAFNTAGLLFYRKDLFQKYGYSNPPQTWDELEEMSSSVQQGERVTNPNFWGYVWQGQSYEGLVCNFLEWTYSNGDDVWIDKDRRITVDNPQNIAILDRAKSWIGTISPPGVLAFKEEASRAVFQAGDALFLRGWFYVYNLANADDSLLKDLVGIASVPAGDAGHGAATIGTWSTGISRYSKHPQETFEFLQFLMSYENTLRRAKETSEFPPYTAAYQDEDFLKEVPTIALLNPIFENSVARPSVITAPNYNAVSTRIARSVHDVLSGRSEATEAMTELAFDIQEITGFEIAN